MRPLTLPLLAALALACSAPPKPAADAGQPTVIPRTCVGGVVLPDGSCVAKCDPSKCLPGNTCVNNACALECTAHSQCIQYAQSCLPATEDDTGRQLFACTDTAVIVYGDPCPKGTECGTSLCNWSGPGDARAYCTVECVADSDCPGGYECGYRRDPHLICGTTKGDNNHCGTTTDPCIDRASLVPDGGGTLVEGEFCLQQRLCLKKEACATCDSDVDCSWGVNLTCVQLPDDKRCLAGCVQDSDCDDNMKCTDGSCVPRAESCQGGSFCSPCRYDSDCPANHACSQLHGNEKACIDITFATACNVDNDCPKSPGGRPGACLDNRHNVSSGSSVYHRCYAPHNGNYFTCFY